MKDIKFNLPTSLATIGVVIGIGYAMKKDKGFFMTSVLALGFGFAGLFIGNKIEDYRNE